MTQRQAREEGLFFTGHYESYYDKDKLKNIAAAIRKLYKCRVVMVDEGHGISLYADRKYRALENMRDDLRIINLEGESLKRLEEKYKAKVDEILSRTKHAREDIELIKEEFPDAFDIGYDSIYEYMRQQKAQKA